VRIVFLGPPGAGKGTQTRLLRARLRLHQIATGDMLRANLANGTKLGREAQPYVERGELVPDSLVIAMIEGELDRNAAGFVMDGFPRTVAQAEALDAMLARRGTPLDAALLLKVERAVLIARLSARWTNPRTGRTYNALTSPPKVAGICDDDGKPLVQREDDRAETVAKRLQVYDEQTRPLVDYYRKAGKLIEIDALGSIEAVTDRIAAAIGAATHSEAS